MSGIDTFQRHRLSIGWGLLILVFTGIPGQMVPRVSGIIDLLEPDKLVHLLLFGGFVVCLLRDFSRIPGFCFRKSALVAILITVLMGAITELLQWKVFINREASIWDFVADCLGCLAGLLIAFRWKGFFLRDSF